MNRDSNLKFEVVHDINTFYFPIGMQSFQNLYFFIRSKVVYSTFLYIAYDYLKKVKKQGVGYNFPAETSMTQT